MRDQIVTLVDYINEAGAEMGTIMDMGEDIALIAHQLSILEKSPPPGRTFLKAYILSMHDEQPDHFYVPDNAFGREACGLDGSAQLPMGKRWFKLVLRMEPGLFEEE